jgi:archaemetzincin
MSSILIVPIRPVDHAELTALVAPLSNAFELPVSIEESRYLDPSFAFYSYRNQFNSTSIIAELLNRFPEHSGKIIGITAVDLFVPVLTYVFGEAQLDGRIAVLSTYRLREELYGLDPNPKLEQIRLLKEAIHELGHTFGLIHCHNPECVMHSSTSAEEVDVKGKNFCEECNQTVQSSISPFSEQA